MWRVIGDAVQGKSHIKQNVPCQDKVYTLNRNNCIAAALSDGAGSAALSHYGAECITKSICEFLCEHYDRLYMEENGVLVKQELMKYISLKLNETCSMMQCEYRDLASTVLAVAIKDETFIIVHLGDGVIGYLKGEDLRTASTPENGEFVNETVFTTSVNAIKALQLKKGKLGAIIGFVMMSDGAEISLYNKKTKQLVPGLKNVMLNCSLLSCEEAQEAIKDSLENVLKEKTSDDCSILVMINREKLIARFLENDKYKRIIFGQKPDATKKKKKHDFITELLEYTLTAKSLDQISRRFYISKKVAKKRIKQLEQYEIIRQYNGHYKNMIRM